MNPDPTLTLPALPPALLLPGQPGQRVPVPCQAWERREVSTRLRIPRGAAGPGSGPGSEGSRSLSCPPGHSQPHPSLGSRPEAAQRRPAIGTPGTAGLHVSRRGGDPGQGGGSWTGHGPAPDTDLGLQSPSPLTMRPGASLHLRGRLWVPMAFPRGHGSPKVSELLASWVPGWARLPLSRGTSQGTWTSSRAGISTLARRAPTGRTGCGRVAQEGRGHCQGGNPPPPRPATRPSV